ncbi:hypothetical protein FSP39_019370 [Pinctada imbricata]|uniref:G-protein coupled receptors family 1 profile domain-containing protein n=1 Tax=Pinctada imbricata TaxID=66713 RepID=A0AA88YKZ6_PINIB|nr:hypothetical protein FSP39_019370 [Pinctada imbricata]
MSNEIPNVTDANLNTSTSNLEEPPFDEPSLLVLNILTTFIFLVSIVGTTGNSFVLLIYIRSKQLQDAATKFILNLAVTDLCTAIFIAIYEILLLIDVSLTATSKITCLIWEQILTFFMFVSQSVIAVATFDRYMAVCHHVLYRKIMTKMVVITLLAMAWILPLCFAAIPFFGFNTYDEFPECVFEYLLPDWMYVTLSSIMIVLMGIPFVLYIMIFKTAIGFYRRFESAKGKARGNEADDERNRERKKAIKNGKIMGTVTLIFIICWLPFQIFQFFFGSRFDVKYRTAVATTYYIGILNCVVNPFIYAWQKKKFKEEAKKFLTCICRPEIEQLQDKTKPNDDKHLKKTEEIRPLGKSEDQDQQSNETESKTQSGSSD